MCFVICVILLAHAAKAVNKFEPLEYWKQKGFDDIVRAQQMRQNKNIAKNVVIMIGNGMGLPTVTAGRIYKGQKAGFTGEEYKLHFENFPHVALSKTYNLDIQTPDSAGTAIAMLTGIKVNYGTLGVNGDVPFGESCSSYDRSKDLKTAFDYALETGKSIGFVTTTRVTHATPGAIYAHTPYRDWESDSDMKGVPGCGHLKDIAYQLVYDNPNIQVILGGGRRSFLNNTTPDPVTKKISSNQRSDGLDLIEVGLFNSNDLSYELERDKSAAGEPSLTKMTEVAINILKKNPKGFFLMVEGGRIDQAHHNNSAKKALEELAVFDDTVQKVTCMTSSKDTLQIVTADHSHVFVVGGYPSRGNDILGTIDIFYEGEGAHDGLPVLTLSYANGPDYGRKDLTGVDTTGPMAHLFHTTHEQSYIGHVMMYSSCIGFYLDKCEAHKRSGLIHRLSAKV